MDKKRIDLLSSLNRIGIQRTITILLKRIPKDTTFRLITFVGAVSQGTGRGSFSFQVSVSCSCRKETNISDLSFSDIFD